MNLLIIFIAGVINMGIGALWYSPVLFAKPWMKANGLDKKTKAEWEEAKKSMGPKYGLMFVSSLVLAYVLSWFINMTGAHTAMNGVTVGFLAWLGFTTTSQLGNWLFSDKPKTAYFVDTGYQLVSYTLLGAILGQFLY